MIPNVPCCILCGSKSYININTWISLIWLPPPAVSGFNFFSQSFPHLYLGKYLRRPITNFLEIIDHSHHACFSMSNCSTSSSRWNVLSWAPWASYQCQGTTPATRREAKTIRRPRAQSAAMEIQTLPNPVFGSWSCQGKHSNPTQEGTILLFTQIKQSKQSQLQKCASVPHGQQVPLQSVQGNWQVSQRCREIRKLMHLIPPLLPKLDSSPSPVEPEILKAGGMSRGHWCTCTCRTKEHVLITK